MAAGDRPLGAEILSGMSHQAGYLGDGRTAVLLAQAAGRTTTRSGLGVLAAEAAVSEAHGHALLGDEPACAKALARAGSLFELADRACAPRWIGYLDEAYLSARFGHCFLALGHTDQALSHAQRSLRMDENYRRGKAFNLALVATSHARLGQVDEAVRVGVDALGLAKELSSERAWAYLDRLGESIGRGARSTAGDAFLADLRSERS
jgi:tetratricopeptide (TPR) repeat protein